MMKKLNFNLLTAFFMLSAQWLMAQTVTDLSAENLVKGASLVRINQQSQIPYHVVFKLGSEPAWNEITNWLRSACNLDSKVGFIQLSADADKLGFIHYRYQQTYNGIPVSGSVLIAHVQDYKIKSINGVAFDHITATSSPSLSETEALSKALNYVNARTYKWQLAEEENFIKREQNDIHATFYPKGELVYASNSKKQFGSDYKLAYRFDIYAQEPMSRKYVFVDASTGIIIDDQDRIHEANTPATAQTVYSGSQTIITDSNAGSYRLREAGRGAGLGMETYNLQKGTSYAAAVDFTDTDNIWNNINANLDQYATDAHLATEKTYDYYYNVYGRNSINNAGLKLLSYIHYSTNYVNAFWDGTRMTYGDGNATYSPLVSLDIGGHEITHGLTSYTANLTYSYQSGALNESFSDIFGETIESYTKGTAPDWLMGANIGAAFRSFSNPNIYGDPDTYLGTNWYSGTGDNGGVHTNSGVQNFWYYLLANGGTGTNDIGNAYSVTGQGITKAAAIAFRTLTVYLTASSQYADARYYSIQAATDLYGPCSPEVIATTNAWYAVGVGTSQAGAAATITAGGPTTFCEGGSVLLNANAPSGSTYQWNKNGVAISGATSSSYTVSQAGSYTVSTVTCGSGFTSAATIVTVNTISATISPSGSASSCNGSPINLSANTGTGYGYQWNLNGAPISGATSATYSAAATGNYSVSYVAQSYAANNQTNSTTSNIVDNTCTGTANTTITVSGMPTAINPSGITITVNLTHTYDGDIDLVLEAPNGDILGLSNQAGGSGQNFTNTVFSDGGATTVSSGTAPFTGTFKPWSTTWTSCVPITKTSFASLGGGTINPNGAWKFRVYDRASVDIGTINSWSLNIPTGTVPYPNCGPVTSPATAITISNSLNVNAGTYNPLCVSASAITLAGTPAGGTFSGPGVTGNSFNPATAGTGQHTITYNYNNGLCSGSATTVIHVNGLPTVSATNVSGCAGSSIALSGSPAGGTYSVANPYTGPSTTYTYTYTDVNGCSNTSSIASITVNPLPVVTANNVSGCTGSAIPLSGSPVGGTFNLANPYTGPATTYTYTFTDAKGCTNTSASASVNLYPLPTVSAGNYGSLCSNASVITLAGTPTGGSFSGTGVTGNQFNPSIGAGIYPVTYSYTDGNGCSNSASVNIAVNAAPIVTAVNVNGCDGSLIALSGSPSGGTYSVGNPYTGPSTTYTYSFTDAKGCTSMSAPANITVNPLPTVSFSGLASSYTISAAAVALTGSPVGGTFSGPGISGNTFTPATAGVGGPYTISYSYTDGNGCSNSNSQQTSVTNCAVPAQPGTISVTGGAKACPGDTRTYKVTNVAGLTYNWVTPAGGAIQSGQGTNQVVVLYNAGFTANGTMSVTANNGCGASTPRTLAVTRNVPATPGVITGSAIACAGTTGAYSVTNVSGITYSWTASVATVTYPAGQGTNAVTAAFDASFATGTMYVQAGNACGTSAKRSLAITSKPATPSVITGTINGVCGLTGQSYSVTNVAGATYNWTFTSGLAVVASGQGTNSITADYLSGFVSATLNVTATNACGTSPIRSATVKAAPAVPGAITGTTTPCANQNGVPYSIAAVATASQYTWTAPTGSHISDGATTSSGTSLTTTSTSVTVNFGSTAGNVTVKAGNSCGFSSTKNLVVTFACREANLTEEINSGETLQVFPNPFSQSTTLVIPSSVDLQNAEIIIYDVLGKEVQHISNIKDYSLQIERKQLLPGAYLLQLKTEGANKFIKRLLVN